MFQLVPFLKYVLQRFQIYDLIVRGLLNEAKEMYKHNFCSVEKKDEFSVARAHFTLILDNIEITRKVLIDNYSMMKNALALKVRNSLMSVIETTNRNILKADDKYNLRPCGIQDICGFDLLNCERKISFGVTLYLRKQDIDNTKDINVNSSSSSLITFSKDLENKQNNDPAYNLLWDLNNIGYCGDVFTNNNNNNKNTTMASNIKNDNNSQFIKSHELHKKQKNDLPSNSQSLAISTQKASPSKIAIKDIIELYNTNKKREVIIPNTDDYNSNKSSDISSIIGITEFQHLINFDNLEFKFYCSKVYKVNLDTDKAKSINNINNLLSLNNSFQQPSNSIRMQFMVIGKKAKENFFINYNPYNLYASSFLTKTNLNTFNIDNNKYYLNKNCSDFLKQFTPKFIKKEALDKIIIRKFRNFVKQILIENGVLDKKGKAKINNNNLCNEYCNSNDCPSDDTNEKLKFDYMQKNNNINLKDTTIKDKKDRLNSGSTLVTIDTKKSNKQEKNSKDSFDISISFSTIAFKFPYKCNDTTFKSLNFTYLSWLFNDIKLQEYYDIFSKTYSNIIYKAIKDKYNLEEKELTICKKLEDYITNLNKIYSNNDDKNENNKESNYGNREELSDYKENNMLESVSLFHNTNNLKHNIPNNNEQDINYIRNYYYKEYENNSECLFGSHKNSKSSSNNNNFNSDRMLNEEGSDFFGLKYSSAYNDHSNYNYKRSLDAISMTNSDNINNSNNINSDGLDSYNDIYDFINNINN